MSSTAKQPKHLFAHRFDTSHADDFSEVIDSIGLMKEHANGILMLLYSHFNGDMRISNGCIMSALDAVMHEIDDMYEVLNVHLIAVADKDATDKRKQSIPITTHQEA